MMSAQFFLRSSLFALLVMGIDCIPLKGGSPGSYGGGHRNEAPSFRSNYGASSSAYAPGDMSYNAPSKDISRTSYQPVPQPEPQPAVYREPAAPAESSSVSGPAELGHGSSAVRKQPVGSTAPGAAYQPGSREIEWSVAPPSIFSGEMPAATGYVSPPLPPPEPLYQAGELVHSEHRFESGDFEGETEETGFLPPLPPPPPLPMHESAGPSFTSQPRPMPQPMPHPGWGFYPYYDYMFLTGQYPPGTVTHASSSFEQGRDHWQDVHYVRDHYPQNPSPQPQAEPINVPSAPRQGLKAAGPHVAPYGRGAVAAGLPGSSHRRPAQPPGGHMDYRVKVGY